MYTASENVTVLCTVEATDEVAIYPTQLVGWMIRARNTYVILSNSIINFNQKKKTIQTKLVKNISSKCKGM